MIVTSWCLAFKCAYWYLGMSTGVCSKALRCMPLLHNGLQVDQSVHNWHLTLACLRISSSCILKLKYMTLAIIMFNNIFPLYIKIQNYHSSTPNCYAKCYKTNIFSLKILLMLTHSIMLAISGHDTETSRHLFLAFTCSVHDTKYHERCSMFSNGWKLVEILHKQVP